MKGRAEDLAWKSINEAPRFLDLSRKSCHEKFYMRTFLNDSPLINQAFSIFTFIYLALIVAYKELSWSYFNIVLFAIFGSILTLFPLVELKRGDYTAILLAIQTSMLLISVIILEFVIGETKYLTPYFSLALIYRQIQRENVLDNIALCLVYTADVTIGFHDKTRFDSGKLLVWISLILGLSLGNAVSRIKRRLWEHLCVLLIFHLKCEEEAILGNAIVSAHFPQDLVLELVEDFVEEKRIIKSNHLPIQSEEVSRNKAISNICPITTTTSFPEDNHLNHNTSQIHLPIAAEMLLTSSKSNANENNNNSNNNKGWKFFNFNRKLHPLTNNDHRRNNKSVNLTKHDPLTTEITNKLINNESITNNDEVDLELLIDNEENSSQIPDAMTVTTNDETKDGFSCTVMDRSVTIGAASIPHTENEEETFDSRHTKMEPNPNRIRQPQVEVILPPRNIDIIAQAINSGLLPKYTDPILSPEVIDSLTGVDSRYCTVIAIKLDIGEHSECALNNIGKHVVYDIIDAAAEFHKIACVRKFGGTWIGCVGYFKNKRWEIDSERNNCLHAIKLACEITKMAKLYNWSVCSAIDAGNIIGGFINDRMSFDLIGPEVRWVLNISDSGRAGEIFLSGTVHRTVQKCEEIIEKKLSINKNLVECSSDGNTRLYSVGVMHEELKLRNLEDILNLPELSQNAVRNEKAWSSIHKMSEKLNTPNKSTAASYREVSHSPYHATATTNGALGPPPSASTPTPVTSIYSNYCPFSVLASDLSKEFRTSLSERYGVDTNTDILTELDDKLLDTKLHQLYLDLQKLVNEIILVGLGRYALMPSNLPLHVAGDEPIDTLPMPIDTPTTELNIFQCFLDSIPSMFTFPKTISLLFTNCRIYLFGRKRQIPVDLATVNDTATAAARIEHSQRIRGHGILSLLYRAASPMPACLSNIVRNMSSVFPWWQHHHHHQQQQQQRLERKPSYDPAEVIQPHDVLIDDNISPQSSKHEINDGTKNTTTTKANNNNNNNNNNTSELHFNQISANKQNVSYFRRVFNITLPSPSPPSPTIQRGWGKYYEDMSVLSHSTAIMYITLLIFSLVTFYVMITPNITEHSYVFTLFVACILLPFTIIYKRNNCYLIMMPLIRGIFVLLLPVQFYCIHSTSTTTKEKNFQNKFLILAFFFIPEVVNHQVHVVFLEYGLYFILFFSRLHFYQNLDSQCYISCYSTLIVCIRGFLIVTLVYTSQYLILLCYVVEHVLAPAAKESLRRQCEYTRSILQRSVRAVGSGAGGGAGAGGKDRSPVTCPKLSHACRLIFPRRYRNCAVVAIHIKAADVLPVVVRASDSSEFLKQLYQVFDESLRQCGLIKVTQFSGLVIAVACKGAILDTLSGMQSQITHTTRGVNVLRMIQKKLDEFNRKHNVSVMVGVGVNQGAVCMGFLGNDRYCFDISGVTRDIACSMAINESNGMIVSESFFDDISKTINVENNERYDFIPSNDIMSTSKWIKVYLNGTSFGGMRLEDFEHVRLLGKGGYGSVHLVRDKTFNIRYAVKVIPRTSAQNTKLIQRELHTLQQMNHSHVVGFKYCLFREKRIYLVMTYIRGGNMSEIVERNKLTLADLRLWFAELVLALEYVHELGIIHRDVKPANCMIGADGHLRLADFGLSKMYLEQTPSRAGSGGNGGGGHSSNESSLSYDSMGNSELDPPSIGCNDTMLFMQKVFPMRESKDVPLKVLVIENALKAESSLANTLRKMYIFQFLLIASYGEDALRKIKANAGIDMVIVDVSSQVKETCAVAMEAIAQLQLDPVAKGLLIIAVIEGHKDDIREAVLQSGAMEVLETPLSRHRDHLLLLGQHCRQRRSSIVESEKSLSISAFEVEEQEGAEKEDGDGDRDINIDLIQGYQQQQQERDLAIKRALAAAVATVTDPSTMAADVIPNKSCKVTQVTEQNNNSAIVGTLHYIAPEVIEHHHYSTAVDWWACGVTFFECATRERLFTGSCKKDVFLSILTSPINVSPLAELSPALESITKSFLQRDVNKRLGSSSSSEIKSHIFFEDISWNSISKSDPPFKPAQNLEKVEDDGNQALARSLFYCNEDLKRLRSNSFHSNSSSIGDRKGIKRNKKSRKDPIYNRSGILLSSMIDGAGFSVNIPLHEVGEEDENQNDVGKGG